MLGEGGEALAALAAGDASLGRTLRGAKNPMLIARAGGAGPAGRRAGAGGGARARRKLRHRSATAGTGSTCCTAPRRGSAGSISASCRGRAGATSPASSRAADRATIEVLYLLGADEIDLAISARPLSSIRAITATAARRAPTSCCRAPPIPRRTAPTSTPRDGRSSAAARCFRPARRARIGRSCARSRARSAGRCPSNSLRELRRQHARRPSGLRRDRSA